MTKRTRLIAMLLFVTIFMLSQAACNRSLAVEPTPGPTNATPTPAHIFRLTSVEPSKTGFGWLEQTRMALQNRLINEVTGAVSVRIESPQLVVEVADSNDIEIVRQMLAQQHSTVFFVTDSSFSEGSPTPDGTMALMFGSEIVSAHAEALPSGEWQVHVQLTDLGGRILDTFASANQGRYLTIVQDGLVIKSSAIYWHDAEKTAGIHISDTSADIFDALTETSAKALATQLNNSQLPIVLDIQDMTNP
jgi:preprotein translocase subunit SecD